MLRSAVLALVAILASVAGLEAQEVRLEARPLLGSHYRHGGLLPVRVRVANPGADEARYLLHLEQSSAGTTAATTSVLPLHLPPRSRKQSIVYVPAPAPMPRFSVTLTTERGRLVAERELLATPIEHRERLVAVLGDDAVGLRGLRLEDPATYVQRVGFPLPADWWSWRMLDALVWPDPEPGTLPAEQADALAAWVDAGGCLIVAVPRGRSPVAGSFLEALIPASVAEHVALAPVPGVSDAAITRSFLSDPRGEVLVGTPRDPVVVAGRRGHGRVVVLAFDPRAGAFLRSRASRDFWKVLLERLVPHPPERDEATAGSGSNASWQLRRLVNETLAQAPGVRLRGVWSVAILLGCYLLAIGPVDFLLQRRLGRRSWSWLSYPLFILVFSGAILATASHYRKPGARVRSIIAQDWRDGAARTRALGALSSERRGALTLSAAEPRVHFAASGQVSGQLARYSRHGGRLAGGSVALSASAASLECGFEAWQATHFEAHSVERREPWIEAWKQADGWRLVSHAPFDLGPVTLIEGDRLWRRPRLRSGDTAIAHQVSTSELQWSGEKLWGLHYGPAAAELTSLSETFTAMTLLEDYLARMPESDEHREHVVSLRQALSSHELEWLVIDPSERGDCALLIAFAQGVEPPVRIPGRVSLDSVLMVRQILCGGAS